MAKMNARIRVRLGVSALILLALVVGVFVYPKYVDQGVDALNAKYGWHVPHVPTDPFILGLDLQGGTQLVYEANLAGVDVTEQDASVEGVRDVIERRVNAFGVAEPVVQTNRAGDSYRVIVELAGIKDVAKAIEMIGQTPLLEFKEQNMEPARELTAEEKKAMETFNADAKKKADALLKQVQASGADFAALAKESSDDITTKETGGALGKIGVQDFGHRELYDALVAAKPAANTVLSKYVQTTDGYNIVRINELAEGPAEVKAAHLLVCFKDAKGCDKEMTKEEALKKIQELKAKATPENFVQLVKDNSTEPGAAERGGDLGFFTKEMMVAPFAEAAFALEKGKISDVVETDFGFHLIHKTDERTTQLYDIARILVKTQQASDILPPAEPWKNTALSGKQLKRATVTFDPYTNAPQVSLDFNDEGKQLFADITTRNVNKQVGIYLDGVVISDPRVNEPITDGQAVISGGFTLSDAKLLSQRLNAGALPVPITLISQQTIGASLGAESLSQSVLAGLIGFLLVLAFMIFYYRLPGLFAVIALAAYTAFLLGMFKLINVTITLSGIAGIIISIGMAIDANVLIFERLKEEMKKGKPLGSAIDEAFRRAWPSIRDGNFSTLITCLVLFWFGTSSIKGFSLTLSIGILVSMFTAITVTRLLLKVAVPKVEKEQSWLWMGVKPDPKV